MRLSLSLFLIALCVFSSAKAQKKINNLPHQLLVISENDSYAFHRIDRYYTNGFALRFSKSLGMKRRGEKSFTAEFGQDIYTGYSIKRDYAYYLDRPFTGFLYVKAGPTNFYKNENVFGWNVLAGVIGKPAGGEPMQRAIHKIMRFIEPSGWETQLKTEWGLNGQAAYYQHLVNHQRRTKRNFDAFAVSKVTAGNTFDKVSEGILFRMGTMAAPHQSAWWQQSINKAESNQALNHELFFYFMPAIEMQLFNATIQGGMFSKNNPFTARIQPFVYSHQFGGMYAKDQFSLRLGYTFTTKDTKNMLANSTYGTIALGLRF